MKITINNPNRHTVEIEIAPDQFLADVLKSLVLALKAQGFSYVQDLTAHCGDFEHSTRD